MVLPSCAFASPGRALIGAPLPDRFFISFGSLLYVCWLSENAALYLDCWTLFRSFQKGDAEAPRLNKKGRTAESSRCAWSGRQSRRESRQGVRGVAGRVVTVCVEWPAESSGESSRCAWSGRQSRRESRQGVRGVAGRVVGRVVKVCVEWTGESSRCVRESRRSGQMYGSASSRSRDRTQADGAVIHLELERSCGSIPAGLRGGTSHQVLTRLSSAARAELDGLRPGMDNVAPSSGAGGRGLRPNKNYCPLRLWSLRPTKNTTSSRATTGVDKSVFLLRLSFLYHPTPKRARLFCVSS